MTNVLWTLCIDFLHGFVDSIVGFKFIFYLDRGTRIVPKVTTPVKVTSVLHQRRQLKGQKVFVPDEDVSPAIRQKEPAWKRIFQCAAYNFAFALIFLFMGLLFTSALNHFSLLSDVDFSFFLCLPIFLISRLQMALWFQDISNSCQKAIRIKPMDINLPFGEVVSSILIGFFFLLQALVFACLPFPIIGAVASFVHISLLNSMYSFEYLWVSGEVPLPSRISRMEERWAYFTGFGAPLTIVSSLSSYFIVNGCIYAALFPFLIISSFNAHELWKQERLELPPIPVIRVFTPTHVIVSRIAVAIGDTVPEKIRVNFQPPNFD